MGLGISRSSGSASSEPQPAVGRASFVAVIPNDDSTREKLRVMSGIELIFDDDRIVVPDTYFDLCQSIEPGDVVEIRIAVTKSRRIQERDAKEDGE